VVLVDVIALNPKNGVTDGTLKRDDLQCSIVAAPLQSKLLTQVLPLGPLRSCLVQCNMPGWEAKGSGLFAGRISA
jgi:hypothetical protein